MADIDTWWSKVISAELLGSILITIVAVTTSWVSLAKDAEVTADQVDVIQADQREMQHNISQIQIDISGIRANQSSSKEDLVLIRQAQEEFRQDIKKILERGSR